MPGPMRGNKGPTQKAKDAKGTLKRLLKYFNDHKIAIVVILIFAILSTIFSIVGPKILGKATTALYTGMIERFKGTGGVDFGHIGKILLGLGGLYLVSALFSYIQQYMMAGVSQTIVYKLRKEVSNKLSKLPLKYYDKNTKGDILSRTTNDIENVSAIIGQAITQVITSIATIIGIISMMISINLMLTGITVLVIPISVFLIGVIAKKSQKYFTKQWDVTGDLNGHVEEMFTGHQIVKAFGNEDKSIEKFKKLNEELYEASWKAQFISGVIKPIMDFGSNINYVIICLVGAIKVTSGNMALGDIQAFVQYSRHEEEEVKDRADAVTIKELKGNVKIDNIDFSYSSDKKLIQNMNLDIKPGAKVAIVGPTGAGKTTIVNLLMRFYDVDKGSILVDGVNIKSMRRGYLRSLYGMVLQDTWLFNGTVKENIAYGKESATDEEIIEAAKTACADHFIKTLPHGYDTILDEDATNISQGQKQLLTIARAFLANSPIIILDEATSSVDTRTEKLIQEAMDRLMKGRTSFVIAHRLSTIKNADIILVMDNGTIIETGTHEELLDKKGFYANLYNSQFTECIDDIA